MGYASQGGDNNPSRNEENPMKKIALLVCILALAICAAAQPGPPGQTMISFNHLTPSTSPTPVPNGYAHLNWEYIYSVSPVEWGGSGRGFTDGPHAVIAFVGGNYVCYFQPAACRATISGGDVARFHVMSASVSAGYQDNVVSFIAYRGGTVVGTQDYNLTVRNQVIDFPPGWGVIDQLVVWPHPTRHSFGSVVFYELSVRPR
jgi:hypothetical protein